jgi:pimeloyl-ACP methyl ester carboxylesterase
MHAETQTHSTDNDGALRHRMISVDDLPIHIVDSESPGDLTFLFIHGWPQNWQCFESVMLRLRQLRPLFRTIAFDLPGIGESPTPPLANDKRTLAGIVNGIIRTLELRNVCLVGHDAGGMIVYAYLFTYPGVVQRAVIMNVAVPGVDPWDEVIRNPRMFHFAFHAVHGLPERLVAGHEREYFDYFYDAIAATPEGISDRARDIYLGAYQRPVSLQTGFDWYRAFERDAEDNKRFASSVCKTPVLYLRGGEERGGFGLNRYVHGLKAAGLSTVSGRIIPHSGHFAPDEQPNAVAALLREFASADGRSMMESIALGG